MEKKRKITVGELRSAAQASALRELNALEVSYVAPSDLVPWDDNPRDNDAAAIKLAGEIRNKGFRVPIVATRDGVIRAGHTRHKAALVLGLERVPVIYQDFIDENEAQAFSLSDNRMAEEAAWDQAKLKNIMSRWESQHGAAEVERMTGFTQQEISSLLDEELDSKAIGSLAKAFGVPPFSVLDARQGYWRERKRVWLTLGILGEDARQSEYPIKYDVKYKGSSNSPANRLARQKPGEGYLGRGHPASTGGSYFDPVLCELVYRWFTPPEGVVLDPFAGRAVAGLIAACLGFEYVGIDLSEAQVEANRNMVDTVRRRWGEDATFVEPTWMVGDAGKLEQALASGLLQSSKPEVDLIFTCPPYYNLEVYSDHPADLSNASNYEVFIKMFEDAMTQAVARLCLNRFVALVVSDTRDKDGYYYGFVADTIKIMQDLGCSLYNDAVLITAAGSLPVRVGKQFRSGRKLGKAHQNVLIFFKGNASIIKKTFPATIEMADLAALLEPDDG